MLGVFVNGLSAWGWEPLWDARPSVPPMERPASPVLLSNATTNSSIAVQFQVSPVKEQGQTMLLWIENHICLQACRSRMHRIRCVARAAPFALFRLCIRCHTLGVNQKATARPPSYSWYARVCVALCESTMSWSRQHVRL